MRLWQVMTRLVCGGPMTTTKPTSAIDGILQRAHSRLVLTRDLTDEAQADCEVIRDLAAALRAERERALEEAARICEDTVTFSEEHENYAPDGALDPCGWCDGLEKAAAMIRALKGGNK